jgi:hypothetical protein
VWATNHVIGWKDYDGKRKNINLEVYPALV